MITWDNVVEATRGIVAQDGAGAVTSIRLADELAVNVDAIRTLSVDPAPFVRSAIDRELAVIARQMNSGGECDWADVLSASLADSIIVGRNFMSASASAATGFVLGEGVISWIDAAITLLEHGSAGDDEWLYRCYRLLAAMVIGSSYTFRSGDGGISSRDEIVPGVRRLIDGLPVPSCR